MFWQKKVEKKNFRRPAWRDKMQGALGYPESSKGQPQLEYMDELAPPYGLEYYRKMKTNDPVVGGLMLHMENIMRNMKWRIQGPNEELIIDMFNSFPGGISWMNFDLASALTYGFYIGEEIWDYRDGKVWLKDISPRFQPTIIAIDDENGNVRQQTTTGNFLMPYSKVVHHMVISENRSPYGVSILRHLYKPYYYKISIEASEMVGYDRDLSGVPMMSAPEGFDFTRTDPDSPNYDPETAATLEWALDTVTGIRKDTLTGIVKPDGWKFEIIRGENRTSVPTNETISRYNNEMTAGVLQNFISLGGFASTNNANVEANIKNFLRACDAYGQATASTYNNVIKKICELNNLDAPTFKFSPVNQESIESLASFFSRMVKNGVITPTTTLEKELLEISDFTFDDDPSNRKELPD